MANKRTPLSKGMRFEVLKRDSFTCQYCGASAPDVILEVDHIQPVAKGGTNDITNLVTSCRDCNRGKSKKTLDDNTAVQKQKKQLDELQKRREQIELMQQWKTELLEEEEAYIDMLDDVVTLYSNGTLSTVGRGKMRALIKQFGFEPVYEALEIALEKYDAEKAISKVGGICYNRKIGRGADYYKGRWSR